MKKGKYNTKYKGTNIEKKIGTHPLLQIYPLIFIIKFDTKTALAWNVFLTTFE